MLLGLRPQLVDMFLLQVQLLLRLNNNPSSCRLEGDRQQLLSAGQVLWAHLPSSCTFFSAWSLTLLIRPSKEQPYLLSPVAPDCFLTIMPQDGLLCVRFFQDFQVRDFLRLA